MEPTDHLLTERAAAARLFCGLRRVQTLVRSGKLPSVRLGPKVVRIRPEDLEAFIAKGGIAKSSRS